LSCCLACTGHWIRSVRHGRILVATAFRTFQLRKQTLDVSTRHEVSVFCRYMRWIHSHAKITACQWLAFCAYFRLLVIVHSRVPPLQHIGDEVFMFKLTRRCFAAWKAAITLMTAMMTEAEHVCRQWALSRPLQAWRSFTISSQRRSCVRSSCLLYSSWPVCIVHDASSRYKHTICRSLCTRHFLVSLQFLSTLV
jgi:hypothetical protein